MKNELLILENSKYLDFQIKIDRNLEYGILSNTTKHHLIPTHFELIPHITIKWTIEWLQLKNINNGIRIDGSNIYINSSLFLHITRDEHNSIHEYLEIQRKALYFKLGIEDHLNTIFFFEEKFERFLAFYPFERHADGKKKEEIKKEQKEQLDAISLIVLSNKFISKFNVEKKNQTKRDEYLSFQKKVNLNFHSKGKKQNISDLKNIIAENYQELSNFTKSADILFEQSCKDLIQKHLIIIKDRKIINGHLTIAYLLNKDKVNLPTGEKNIIEIEFNVLYLLDQQEDKLKKLFKNSK